MLIIDKFVSQLIIFIVTIIVTGGLPSEMDIEDETLGYFYNSFIGCMKDFSVAGKTINVMNIKEGRNLESCSQE